MKKKKKPKVKYFFKKQNKTQNKTKTPQNPPHTLFLRQITAIARALQFTKIFRIMWGSSSVLADFS